MRLYLVRHGQTEWNSAGLAQGHSDIPLDAVGLDQARRLGDLFADKTVDRVLSSDLIRSVQTAEPVAQVHGLSVLTDSRLRERSMGDWEGDSFTEVGTRLQEIADREAVPVFEARPPNGESLIDVWARLEPVASELKQSKGRTVVVAHGGSATLLMALLLGLPPTMARSFRFSNTGFSELRQREDRSLVLVKHNDTSHLAAGPVLSGDVEGVHR